MRFVRKALLHVAVWLTAASTLLAGTPHFQCRCPNGVVKPVCLAPIGVEPCCCCSGQDQGTRPSCCAKQAESSPAKPSPTMPSPKDDSQPGFKPLGCQKTFVPAAAATVDRADLQNHFSFASWTVLTKTPESAAATVLVLARLVEFALPPPVDRHLVLQHLVI